MMKFKKQSVLFLTILVIFATLSKLVFAAKIEWSGLSPIYAIALLSGMLTKNKSTSFAYPLLSLFISDLIIQVLYLGQLFPFAGFYTGQVLNYCLLIGITFIGWLLKGNNYSSLAIGSLLSPTVFFLLSNFSVWASSDFQYFSKSFGGLLACLEAGIPFYKNSLIATFAFTPIILVIYQQIFEKKTSLILS